MTSSDLTPIDRLLDIMARLRDPQTGCPWDIEQTFDTIAPYTIEEAYEVAEAIADKDMAELKSELGDLMFQVVFYAQMSKEEGNFDFNDVVTTVSDKMIARHPHVFGEGNVADADAQIVAWEETKAAERRKKAEKKGQKESALEGVARTLPAFTRAVKLQNRAARVGFDWPDINPVFDKIQEEIAELQHEITHQGSKEDIAEEYGDFLFVVANLGRHLGLEPETVLENANRKFTRRFQQVEQKIIGSGKNINNSSLKEMDNLWNEVKLEEK